MERAPIHRRAPAGGIGDAADERRRIGAPTWRANEPRHWHLKSPAIDHRRHCVRSDWRLHICLHNCISSVLSGVCMRTVLIGTRAIARVREARAFRFGYRKSFYSPPRHSPGCSPFAKRAPFSSHRPNGKGTRRVHRIHASPQS